MYAYLGIEKQTTWCRKHVE